MYNGRVWGYLDEMRVYDSDVGVLLCCHIVVVLRHFHCLCEWLKVLCYRDVVCFSCPVVLVLLL